VISFTLPWALSGLVAAALPLVLHLMQRHEPPEVTFPAVRYLEDATRRRSRRLRIRNWVLLVVRTLLVVFVVLAAAGATWRGGAFGSHAATSLVLIVDNSASSGAVVDGEPQLEALRQAAKGVLDGATPADRLWLVAADGIARAGTADALRADLAGLHPEPLRLDLGTAITGARRIAAGAGGPGTVVVVTDGQRTALGPAEGTGPLLLLHPSSPAPANRSLAALDAGAQPWSPSGGEVTLTVTSSDTVPVPVTLSAGARVVRNVLLSPGIASTQRIGAVPTGWTALTAAMPPDEFRADDSMAVALRVAPPATVQWDSTDRYSGAALDVLAASGRVRRGTGIAFGTLGPAASVVLPPADAAEIGALDRRLEARGAGWKFGTTVIASQQIDSSALLPERIAVSRRVTLEPISGSGEVLATAAGAPWVVRTGDLVLIGSRFDPDWTALPLSAPFVPFLDALLTRAMRGEPITPDATVGQLLRLPDEVTAISTVGTVTPVTGGEWTPHTPGVHYLLADGDTVGAVTVRIDARESALARASEAELRAQWPGAVVAGLDHGPALAFSLGSRRDLRGVLLLLALVCVIAESILAGRLRLPT
jgi:Aerotolerance regulator N-terminal